MKWRLGSNEIDMKWRLGSNEIHTEEEMKKAPTKQ
jgi:hypothetical protein